MRLKLYVDGVVSCDGHTGRAVVRDLHTNVVLVEQDGVATLDKQHTDPAAAGDSDVVTPEQIAQQVADMVAEEYREKLQLKPHVPEILDWLDQQDIPYGVATATYGELAEAALRRLDPAVEIVGMPCPLFVPLVENGRISRGDVVIETVARDCIGVTVAYILEWFGIPIDIEEAIRERDW